MKNIIALLVGFMLGATICLLLARCATNLSGDCPSGCVKLFGENNNSYTCNCVALENRKCGLM